MDVMAESLSLMTTVLVLQMVMYVATLLVGFGFAYLGYLLFVKGVFEGGGDWEGAWGEKNILIKRAAPGTIFALLGTAIVIGMFIVAIAHEYGSPDRAVDEVAEVGQRALETNEAAEEKRFQDISKKVHAILGRVSE